MYNLPIKYLSRLSGINGKIEEYLSKYPNYRLFLEDTNKNNSKHNLFLNDHY